VTSGLMCKRCGAEHPIACAECDPAARHDLTWAATKAAVAVAREYELDLTLLNVQVMVEAALAVVLRGAAPPEGALREAVARYLCEHFADFNDPSEGHDWPFMLPTQKEKWFAHADALRGAVSPSPGTNEGAA
jgi:hypothetical protein